MLFRSCPIALHAILSFIVSTVGSIAVPVWLTISFHEQFEKAGISIGLIDTIAFFFCGFIFSSCFNILVSSPCPKCEGLTNPTWKMLSNRQRIAYECSKCGNIHITKFGGAQSSI